MLPYTGLHSNGRLLALPINSFVVQTLIIHKTPQKNLTIIPKMGCLMVIIIRVGIIKITFKVPLSRVTYLSLRLNHNIQRRKDIQIWNVTKRAPNLPSLS